MTIRIDMANKTTSRVPSRHFFILAAEETIKSLARETGRMGRKIPRSMEISLVFMPEKLMRMLQRTWRGKNRQTDVLSFPRFTAKSRPRRPLLKLGKITPMADGDGVIRLGEIVIAPSVARKEASLFSHTAHEHYLFLFVHGLLHLLGYDHETLKHDERIMQLVQSAVLKTLS